MPGRIGRLVQKPHWQSQRPYRRTFCSDRVRSSDSFVILPCVDCGSYRSPAAKVALPSAGGVGYSVKSHNNDDAYVSIDVDTSATLIAKRRRSVLPKGRRLSNRNGLATGTVPYIQRFLSAGPLGRITQPRQGIWNSAPDEQAESGCSKFRFRPARRRVAVQPFPPLCCAGHSARRLGRGRKRIIRTLRRIRRVGTARCAFAHLRLLRLLTVVEMISLRAKPTAFS